VGWSEREFEAISAIFATFVEPAYEGESARHAALAVEALNEVAEPADLNLLRLLLRAFESPAGSVALAHGRRPFSKLPRERREQILLRWSTSPIARRRTFYQTLKRLACFFAYADPGIAGVNPRWARIGYEPAVEQPLVDPSRVASAIIDVDRWAARPLELSAEVVIVGSGAGGGVIASRLAEAGHDVLVIEAGPYAPERDMPTDELSAFDRLYLDHGMTSSADLAVAILAGAALGGGTLVNWTTCIEPPAWIRHEWATDHGLSDLDGASTDDDLARLHTELGFWSPQSIGPKDEAIFRGAAALGWEASPTQRDADGCGDCGSCGFGCRRGAKLSGQRRHLADAARHGARFLAGARVDRVLMSEGSATGVEGMAGSRPFGIRARAVVVAAGALRTPAVLLKSGLAHPQIGRNLHLHPTVVVAGLMSEPIRMWRDTLQAARSTQFIRDRILIESAPGHPGLIALAFPWAGDSAMAQLMGDSARLSPLIGIVRDHGSGRVSVSRSGRARIAYRLDGRDASSARLAFVNMARLARAAGAERVVAVGTPGAWFDGGGEQAWDAYLGRLEHFDMGANRAMVFSAHQMGTARAGADAAASATDPFGRVRRDARGGLLKGLYVGDASLFPTALGVNPMVSVMALAARVARAVDADLR